MQGFEQLQQGLAEWAAKVLPAGLKRELGTKMQV